MGRWWSVLRSGQLACFLDEEGTTHHSTLGVSSASTPCKALLGGLNDKTEFEDLTRGSEISSMKTYQRSSFHMIV